VLIQDEEKLARSAVSAKEINFISPDSLKLLRTKKVRSIKLAKRDLNNLQYFYPLADAYLKELQTANESSNIPDHSTPKGVVESVQPMDATPDTNTSDRIVQRTGDSVSNKNDTPDVPMRFVEKKRLEWTGKTCACVSLVIRLGLTGVDALKDLAPLTTVGNLVRYPFKSVLVVPF
jgi:tRNA-dihydrouridine synthase 3